MRHIPEEVETQHKQAPTNNCFPYASNGKDDGELQNANEFHGRNSHERQGPVTHLGCLQVSV